LFSYLYSMECIGPKSKFINYLFAFPPVEKRFTDCSY